MIAHNGFLDDDDATKEAGTDFASRGDSAPRNSDDDADVADFFSFFERPSAAPTAHSV